MKCLKLGCEKEAKPGFEACTAIHGADIRLYRSQIRDAFSANTQSSVLSEVRSLYSIEDAQHYVT